MTDSVAQARKKYCRYGLWIVCALFICGMIYDAAMYRDNHTSLVISAVFSLASVYTFAGCWAWIARTSPSQLAKFYMAASAVRMLLAAVVVAVTCFMLHDRAQSLTFVVVFAVFYMALLVYNIVFFARTEKNNNK